MKRFVKNAAVMAGGSAGAQLLLLIATPVITRLYTPQDFGILAVYIGLLALFCVIASFRYEMAIPVPEKDDEAISLVFLSLILVVLTAIFSCILIAIFGESIVILLKIPKLEELLWLLPLGVFLLVYIRYLINMQLEKNFLRT